MAPKPASELDPGAEILVDNARDERSSTLRGPQQTHPSSSSSSPGRSLEDGCWHQFVDLTPDVHLEVQVGPTNDDTSSYQVYDVDARIQCVLEWQETQDGHDAHLLVRLMSGHLDELSLLDLVHLPGGEQALDEFKAAASREASFSHESSSSRMRRSSRNTKRKRVKDYVDLTQIDLSDSDSIIVKGRKRKRLVIRPSNPTGVDDYHSDSEDIFGKNTRILHRRSSNLKSNSSSSLHLRDAESEGNSEAESGGATDSDNFIDALTKSTKWKSRKPRRLPGRPRKAEHRQLRRSGRAIQPYGSMKERYEDEIPEIEPSQGGKPRPIGAQEKFSTLSPSDEFRCRHLQGCIVCGDSDEAKSRGPLVFCAGCTDAYHSGCLGARSTRDHLVTKVGDSEFALQCRRCIDIPAGKDPMAPHFNKCQECTKAGAASKPFRVRKTPKEEQKDREANDGKDPVTLVDPELLNKIKNIMFRCVLCHRAWHMHHLPAREESLFEIEDQDERSEKRWQEYSGHFTCDVCLDHPLKIDGLVAWRPKNTQKYVYGTSPERISDDKKEYLVRWAGRSYSEAKWMPGPWVWSVANKTMVSAFYKRNNGNVQPIMRTEDAIPEDFLRVDIVFKVRYNNIVSDQIEEVDLARIREVECALVKYKGLGYEDVVWDQPPDPKTTPERWQDFKTAYEDWVRGNYIRLPPSSTLNSNLRRLRALPFEEKVLLKEQPKSLKGGELMDYQLDGLNWLYYQWHRRQNAILADEMGLGKTIQVIGFLSTLQDKHHCWPFLVIVPNSTCANWKREIRQWAPSLRVVTYFGSSRAQELTEKHVLFRENKKDLACHVVVTSYEAAQSQNCQSVLRWVYWQALIVDEGQRLKNDDGLLYKALSALRTPFKLLLTGTPLQNNQREIFNLLQFLDPTKDARALGEKYSELDKDNIIDLHNMLRPFFLRRTKAQVLNFLPTMAQIIVPVSMSGLQKELYKSIIAKNAELLRSVFGGEKRASAKGGLRNILMQLRKCLCHPFVYNLEIEERSVEAAVSHQRLVEASSKLQLLELMLPKLHERGHRVLIFSQFLDMLTIMEDFLQDLGLEHLRLDGSMDSLEKQNRIDRFNADDSKVFAFLLSTRAGGVGINLATADTVIILDPDFNPHQDIQAISRAHRIGQKKKVLVFQLMTRASAEEKIMQTGRKKMALDHALIDSMEAEEQQVDDLEAVLRFGAEALFKDDDTSDIRYDSVSVDSLLDRSQVENTKTNEQNTVESQFSFARIWQNESYTMADAVGVSDDDAAQPGVWDQILAERSRRAQLEAALKAEKLGRGKRHRKDVVYHTDGNLLDDEALVNALEVDETIHDEANGDTDFQVQPESEEDDDSEGDASNDPIDLDDPQFVPKSRGRLVPNQPLPPPSVLKRASVPPISQPPPPNAAYCIACTKVHALGSCPLKLAGYEPCPLCGIAHFGHMRTCPHLNSETQVRLMLQALEQSSEPRELVDRARKMLKNLKTNLVQLKKARTKRILAGENSNADILAQGNAKGFLPIGKENRAPVGDDSKPATGANIPARPMPPLQGPTSLAEAGTQVPPQPSQSQQRQHTSDQLASAWPRQQHQEQHRLHYVPSWWILPRSHEQPAPPGHSVVPITPELLAQIPQEFKTQPTFSTYFFHQNTDTQEYGSGPYGGRFWEGSDPRRAQVAPPPHIPPAFAPRHPVAAASPSHLSYSRPDLARSPAQRGKGQGPGEN